MNNDATDPLPNPRRDGLRGRRRAVAVLALVAVTIAVTVPLRMVGVPAANLLGPLLVGGGFGLAGSRLQTPKALSFAGQATIGVIAATALTGPTVHLIVQRWPLFLLMGVLVLLLSSICSFVIAKKGWLPGSTAVWGLAPGASAAMVAMATESDADPRLVAIMQYMRILTVSFAAVGISGLFPQHGLSHIATQATATPAFSSIAWTLVLIAAGTIVGMKTTVPALPILLPTFGGAALIDNDIISVALPWPILAAAYAVIGWGIGLKFDLDLIRYSARAAPRMLLSMFVLLLLCAAISPAVSVLGHVDGLTAYLSTSPGGVDTIAVIAASTPVDLSFIMPAQIVRFLMVLAAGPSIARYIARRLSRSKG